MSERNGLRYGLLGLALLILLGLLALVINRPAPPSTGGLPGVLPLMQTPLKLSSCACRHYSGSPLCTGSAPLIFADGYLRS